MNKLFRTKRSRQESSFSQRREERLPSPPWPTEPQRVTGASSSATMHCRLDSKQTKIFRELRKTTLLPYDCPRGYHFILIALHNSHTSLFRDNLHWGYQLTIRDRVDDPRIQQLQSFFLNNLLHIGIESPLSLYGMSNIGLKVYPMGAYGGDNALDIVDGVPNEFSMFANKVGQTVQIAAIELTVDDDGICRVITQKSIFQIRRESFQFYLRRRGTLLVHFQCLLDFTYLQNLIKQLKISNIITLKRVFPSQYLCIISPPSFFKKGL